jgi:hypothetical protein
MEKAGVLKDGGWVGRKWRDCFPIFDSNTANFREQKFFFLVQLIMNMTIINKKTIKKLNPRLGVFFLTGL